MEGVVYALFTSPGIALPPVGVLYHRYWPLVPPETESATVPAPHELPFTGEEGAAGNGFTVAVTAVRALSHEPVLMET